MIAADWHVVFRSPSDHHVAIVCTVLESYGIRVVTIDQKRSTYAGVIGAADFNSSIQVCVHESQHIWALRLLENEISFD